MPNLETIIIEPSLDAVPEALDALYSDLRVGGIGLRHIIEPATVSEVVYARGRGFSDLPVFRTLFASAARQFSAEQAFQVDESSDLISAHDWHLPQATHLPKIRMWLHLRAKAEFWLARANDSASPGIGLSEEEVKQNAYAAPALFVPEPGDALLFIDKGWPDVTGTSTIHKVDVPDQDNPGNRMSIYCDTTFVVAA